MTPGQLVRAVSIALDVPEETVIQHDRNLVMAGLRTKGGRGRSAPEVTPVDAARLAVATLGSIRTKDSVATVEHFERSIFRLSKSAEVKWSAGTESRLAEAPLDVLKRLGRGAFDSSIYDLPLGHCFIEALAAVIADASLPIDEFGAFLGRFSELWVSCSSPSGRACIGSAIYEQPEPTIGDPGWAAWAERRYFGSGIHQERTVYGSAIMLLGTAFRDNGPRYANAKEAYAARYGATTQKCAKAGSRTGAR
jgi:hypothetical protein